MKTHLIRIAWYALGLLVFLLHACGKEEDNNLYAPRECVPTSGNVLIDTWTGPIFDGSYAQCVGNACLDFTLDLRSDSTYRLSYLLFNSHAQPVVFFEREDSGRYVFICAEWGYFSRKLTFPYVKGQLILTSDAPEVFPPQTLNIQWDAFWGLEIKTGELGLNFNTRMLL